MIKIQYEYADIGQQIVLSASIPVLVVPNERLWMVEFSETGELVSKPKMVDHCSYYVERLYSWPGERETRQFVASHVEIVTLKGLEDLVLDCKSRLGFASGWFPKREHVKDHLNLRYRGFKGFGDFDSHFPEPGEGSSTF